MIQVPTLELTGRDGARQRIAKPEHPLPERPPLLENQIVHLLVKQNDEAQDHEPLQDIEWNPDPRVLHEITNDPDPDQKNDLLSQEQEVPGGRAAVEILNVLPAQELADPALDVGVEIGRAHV